MVRDRLPEVGGYGLLEDIRHRAERFKRVWNSIESRSILVVVNMDSRERERGELEK